MDAFLVRSMEDFSSDHRHAVIGQALSLLVGRRNHLLPFEEVSKKLQLGGPAYRGLQTVRISSIVGSLSRHQEFDTGFRPIRSHTYDRWVRISEMSYQGKLLPPVQLNKVGALYFVADGNHRVSVARHQGQEFIDAEVCEYSPR